MCIAGSRRGSGESCYQELATDMQERQHSQMEDAEIELIKTNEIMMTLKSVVQTEERQSGEVVNSEEQNAVFVCISDSSLFRNSGAPITSLEVHDESSTKEATFRRLSGAEKLLLESLDIDQYRPRHIGRFLTMHKRRRKKLTTRSLNQEPGILDDIFHGLVQCVLQRAGNWRFNAFTLETVTGGRSLPVLCVHLFHCYGLFRHFSLDVVTVWKLFAFIEEGYHSTNPYHNSIHATDVTQAMHCFLQEKKIKTHLTNLEIMASLIAAVTHDLDHPGVNQPFLVATSNHLAALYQGWAKRRGSAPVGLLSRLDDFTSTSTSTKVDHNCRRGSVPSDITKQQGGSCNRLVLGYRDFSDLRRASLPQETTLENLLENVLTLTSERESISINNNNNNNNNRSNNNGISKFDSTISGMLSPRRGSIPADISELRRDLFRNNVNNKPRNRKKILRRRSSGGPEMFIGGSTDGNDNGMWKKWKKEIGKRDPVPETFINRRGSLPIEMMTVSHTGSTSTLRRSSLWRF